MRFLVSLLLIVSVFWGGYWFVGSRAVENGAIAAIADAEEAGYSLEYSSLNTRGFPSRFDTTIKDIDFLTLSGLRWTAPFFQVFALSYKPNHIIAVWPNEQSFEYQGQRVEISSSDLRASLIVKPNMTFTLDRFQLLGANISADVDSKTAFKTQSLSVATRQGFEPLSHDFSIQLTDMVLPSPVINSEAIEVDSASIDANLVFDTPLNRDAVSPEVTAISLRSAKLTVENVNVILSGELSLDSEGYTTGQLSLVAQNWEASLAMLEKFNMVPTNQIDTIKTVLRGLSAASGSASEIKAPLVVKRGKVFLGFIPVGFIPPL